MSASRKIEVQLVGDAGDLERSLAGALASLKTFGDGAEKSGSKTSFFSKSAKDGERALYDFDKAASKVNKTMSGGPLGLFDAIGNVGYAILKFGSYAQRGGDELGMLGARAGASLAPLSGLGTTLAGMAPLLGTIVGGVAAFGASLLVLPAIAGAVVFVLTALLNVVTILTAAVVAFAGPLLVVTGLLGGLGAAFAFVAMQSLKTTATQQQVHDNLLALHVAQQTYNADLAKYGKNATQTESALIALHKAQDTYETSLFGVQLHLGKLHEQFSNLVDTLKVRFRPELVALAGAASQALTYLNKIAKLPLKQAFDSLGTEGVAMLNKFVYGVANVLKKPFRLAIQVAFGAGGSNANTAIAAWWNSLTNYLFGYTKTKPIHIGSAIVMDTKQVQGALQPVLDFFNSLHLVDTGLRWAREILDGLVNAWNHDKGLRDAVRKILADAGHQAARAFKAAFFAEINSIPWASIGLSIVRRMDLNRAITQMASMAWNAFKGKASSVLGSIAGIAGRAASNAGNAIKNAFGNAFNWVRAKASAVWNAISGFFSNAFDLHFHIPGFGGINAGPIHIPGWAGVTLATGGLVTGGIAGRDSVPALLTPGEVVLNKQQQLSLLHGGGGGVHFHFSGLLIDGPGVKQAAKLVAPEIRRMQARRA